MEKFNKHIKESAGSSRALRGRTSESHISPDTFMFDYRTIET